MAEKTTAELLFISLQNVWQQPYFDHFAALTAAQWDDLGKYARRQQVAGLFYQRLRQHGLDKIAPAALLIKGQQQAQQNTVRNLRLYHDLNQLVTRLHTQQIPVILLKGAYLAAAVYEQIALRQMVDLDILVPLERLEDAVATVTQLGYQPLTPIGNLQGHLQHDHHLPRFVKTGAVSVEIHWTITRPNPAYTIPIQALWARAQPATVAGVEVACLCPEDLLLHVCLHATYHHFLEQGIRFLCDIAAIRKWFADTLDWVQFVQRAQQWGWAPGVYLALQLAVDLLDAGVPAVVLLALKPKSEEGQMLADAQTWLSAQRVTVAQPVSRNFSQMWHDGRILDKANKLIQSIFLPRTVLTTLYPVAADSPIVYLYYLVRIKDLLMRYSQKGWQIWRGEQAILTVTKNQNRLLNWLHSRP